MAKVAKMLKKFWIMRCLITVKEKTIVTPLFSLVSNHSGMVFVVVFTLETARLNVWQVCRLTIVLNQMGAKGELCHPEKG